LLYPLLVEYIVFEEKYITGIRSVSDPIKYMYIFLIRITSKVDLAVSVCPCELFNLGNYKSKNGGIWHVHRFLGFLRKFDSAWCLTLTPV